MERIQSRLKELGHYRGPIDGIFGGGTESAVKAFQRAEELQADGIVGTKTWKHLFDEEEIPAPEILKKPLVWRCLALTGTFETGTPPPACFSGLSGDFDGQGISLGCLQWNFGQESLQPLLSKMFEQHEEVMVDVFSEHQEELHDVLNKPWNKQMNWTRSIQNRNRSVLDEPWRGMFKSLGRIEAFQKLQVETARGLFEQAVELAEEYGLHSERAIALMFDIKVQNGSISDHTESQIRGDIKLLPEWEKGEVARMCIVANRRAEASKPLWVEDVRIRKLTIATGRGSVHGMHYVLDDDYGIRLSKDFSV